MKIFLIELKRLFLYYSRNYSVYPYLSVNNTLHDPSDYVIMWWGDDLTRRWDQIPDSKTSRNFYFTNQRWKMSSEIYDSWKLKATNNEFKTKTFLLSQKINLHDQTRPKKRWGSQESSSGDCGILFTIVRNEGIAAASAHVPRGWARFKKPLE